MATYKDADGKDVEAFTAEEVEAQKKAALDEYAAKNPDKGADLAKVQADLAEANKKLDEALKGGGDDKDQNIKNLRELVKKSQETVETVKSDFQKQISDLKNAGSAEYKNELMEQIVKGDKELEKKIQFHYDQFKGDPLTKQEIKDRLLNAMKLATDKPIPSFLAGVGGAGDRGNAGIPRVGEVQETENGKLMRNTVFGISDEQAKKYAPENFNK